MNRSTRNLRILPLSVIVSLTVLSAFLLFKTTPDSYGQPLPKTYTIYGKGYFENGVWYDIFTDTTKDPTTGKKSYNHAEVAWFNPSAEIPTHIVYDSFSYPVTKVRHGANSASKPDEAWINLPVSLDTCFLTTDKKCSYVNEYKGHEAHWIELLWIGNVNVENLDSFLLMGKFCNTFPDSIKKYRQFAGVAGNIMTYKEPQYFPKYKLYVNNVQVHDIVLPEQADLNKIDISNCEGIRTLTIPSSDTARKEPIKWMPFYGKSSKVRPGTVRFKEDSGYDIDLFYIPADTVVLPGEMRVFNGYGVKSQEYCTSKYFRVVMVWPPNLEIVNFTSGMNWADIEDLPNTVRKIKGFFKLGKNKRGERQVIPAHIEELDSCRFLEGVRVFEIEENSTPLKISGPISADYIADTLIIRRQLNVSDTSINRVFNSNAFRVDYLFFGYKTELIPEAVCRLGYNSTPYYQGPEYLECEGLTPPNFETENPYILNWYANTTLIINKQAEEAYRNHPVWGKFLKIETSGAGHVAADKEAVSEKWYSVDGLLLSGPEPGKTNIRVTTYSDGTTSTTKIAVPE